MKKALVTGANGFIGRHVCYELSNQGISIIALIHSDNNSEFLYNIKGIKIYKIDLKNYDSILHQISERDIDVCFHFAWEGSSGNNRSNLDMQLKNVKYTCELFKLCKLLSCHKFIFAASIMEYEVISQMFRTNKLNINSIYSTSKLAADFYLSALADGLDVSYIRAIISNIYGPGETNPRFINSTLRKLINNEHCSFTSGEQLYDFIYITDAAKAFVSIGKEELKKSTYYIGSGVPKKLKEYLIAMKKQINPNAVLGFGELPDPKYELSFKEFSIEDLKNDTGFMPKVSFEDGIKSTIEWIKETNGRF